MIIGILGFVPLIQRNAKIGIPLVTFLILYVWLLSSWDCWWYASSFSQRSIVQAYPVFIFPFGYLLLWLKNKKTPIKIIFSILGFSLIILNLIQTYQFKKYILHPDRMTKEYYLNSFLELDEYKVNRSLLEPDRNINYLPNNSPEKHNLIYYESFNTKDTSLFFVEGKAFVKEGNCILSKENPYSKNIKFQFNKLTDTTYCYMVCRFRFKSNQEQTESKLGIEFRMVDSYNGNYYDYRRRGIEGISWFKKDSWIPMDMVIIPSILRNKNDSVQFNLVYNGNDKVFIDNMSIEVYDYSKNRANKIKNFINDFHTIKIGNWSDYIMMTTYKDIHYIDSLNPYSSTLFVPYEDFVSKKKLKFNAKVQFEEENMETYMIADIVKQDSSLYYKSIAIQKSKIGWETLDLELDIPSNIIDGSEMKVYLWNKSKEKLLIKHIKADLI
jgi:hypothetical protein